jgi:ribonuclease E
VKPAAEVEDSVAVEADVATIADPQKNAEPVVTSSESEEQKPKRAGWWQKKGFF